MIRPKNIENPRKQRFFRGFFHAMYLYMNSILLSLLSESEPIDKKLITNALYPKTLYIFALTTNSNNNRLMYGYMLGIGHLAKINL